MSAEASLYRELLDRGHRGEVAYWQLVRQNEAQAEKVRRGGDVHEVRYGLLHPKTLFLIARGVVRVVEERSGERENLATLMAGDFFGEMAIIRESPRSATVEAVSNCLLYELHRDALFRLFDRYPAIRESVERADRERRRESEG